MNIEELIKIEAKDEKEYAAQLRYAYISLKDLSLYRLKSLQSCYRIDYKNTVLPTHELIAKLTVINELIKDKE